ncbi:alpha/beta hydrolase [Actibacterium ureilyticum]|uniref:alpha/beta hydrolase n=1 Tax=Actibacterium ureilyticum TaxID=1590614 RepID=UPI001C3EC3C6|nr:alpha/beta hydrolase [Actibacterium ureilyticum]
MIRQLILIWMLVLPGALCAGPDRVLRDVAYGPNPAQRMDVYLPPAPTKAPILVMLHGGGWRFGDKGAPAVWQGKQAHWGARGYIVVSVNTRLLPEADPLAQARDLARAVAHVQARAARWGGDAGRLVLMGHSAGAHLAMLISADPKDFAETGLRPWRATVALDSAAVDVAALMADRPRRLHRAAFGDDPAFWRATSPVAQLSRRAVPALVVCSTKRRLSCPAAQSYARAAGAVGARATVLPVALRHGPINSEMGRAADYTGAVDRFLRAQGLP